MTKDNATHCAKSIALPIPSVPPAMGFDPELLFVECSKCGNPIMWEKGRSTEILLTAGVDPLEIDAHCLLVSDGCPRCSRDNVYHVQIYCVSEDNNTSILGARTIGHA